MNPSRAVGDMTERSNQRVPVHRRGRSTGMNRRPALAAARQSAATVAAQEIKTFSAAAFESERDPSADVHGALIGFERPSVTSFGPGDDHRRVPFLNGSHLDSRNRHI